MGADEFMISNDHCYLMNKLKYFYWKEAMNRKSLDCYYFNPYLTWDIGHNEVRFVSSFFIFK